MLRCTADGEGGGFVLPPPPHWRFHMPTPSDWLSYASHECYGDGAPNGNGAGDGYGAGEAQINDGTGPGNGRGTVKS